MVAMSGEKYPAKLVEKVARAICEAAEGRDADFVPPINRGAVSDMAARPLWTRYLNQARTALDAIPYAAMREALEEITNYYCRLVNSGDCGFWNPEDDEEVKAARAALRAADGEDNK